MSDLISRLLRIHPRYSSFLSFLFSFLTCLFRFLPRPSLLLHKFQKLRPRRRVPLVKKEKENNVRVWFFIYTEEEYVSPANKDSRNPSSTLRDKRERVMRWKRLSTCGTFDTCRPFLFYFSIMPFSTCVLIRLIRLYSSFFLLHYKATAVTYVSTSSTA